jgi:ABC-type sugar transport system permease subunit
LARKYENFFSRSGLWWREYRHHWVWLIITHILTFIGGIVSAMLATQQKP